MHRRSERDPEATFLGGATPASGPRGRTRPRLPRVALALGQVLVGLVALANPAGAARAQDPADDPGFVSVLEVSGLLDRVLVDFVETELAEAEDDDALALVLQLNSGGSVAAHQPLQPP